MSIVGQIANLPGRASVLARQVGNLPHVWRPMFCTAEYQLLDFGNGRRLEGFGGLRTDRPCPAAGRVPVTRPELWAQADARFERAEGADDQAPAGVWLPRRTLPARWTIAWRELHFELKATDFGHVGLFPEQAENWEWVQQQVRQASGPCRVLNLFAYTGGSTLAAAAAGAEVTHVDAARNILAWARRNAQLSRLAEAPIRWIAEDAMKFVRRELRRGHRYEAVILDPPSYGHGTHGEVWRLAQHLPRLLELCGELTAQGRRFILLTCHTPGFDAARLSAMLQAALGGGPGGRIAASPLVLKTPQGRELPSGVVVRWDGG